jgi:phosphatidylglycerophosphate synthase
VIDANIRRLIDPPLTRAGQLLAAAGIGADAVTIGGCLLGLAAALAVSAGRFYVALALLIASRIADGLDGAIARATRPTDRGAFLDIALDFLVYAAVPLGFAAWSPHANAFVPRFCSRASLPTEVLFWPFPSWPRSVA